MSIVYYTKLDEDFSDMLMEKIGRFSPKEANKILNLRLDADRQRCIAGKLLLLHGLNQHGIWGLNYLPDLSFNAFGRPYLEEYPIDFNISHSGDLIVCSFTQNGRTGVDVEKIEPVGFSDFTSVFNADEINRIVTSDCPILDFYQMWTTKEAIMKAEGSGFSLNPLAIHIDTDGECILNQQKWHVTNRVLEPGYQLSVASDCMEKPSFEFVPLSFLSSRSKYNLT
jgi:4'-phosphopantetheinyl transferase